jgi:hypothetical protein
MPLLQEKMVLEKASLFAACRQRRVLYCLHANLPCLKVLGEPYYLQHYDTVAMVVNHWDRTCSLTSCSGRGPALYESQLPQSQKQGVAGLHNVC